MTVADYIADFFVKNSIRHVFGFQGGAILKLVDAMMATGKIRYVQNYHEQASGFCADAYSRVNGNIGVALATSGPGATNLITGIANAQLDSIATLFITGQDYTANVTRNNGARLNGFQDLDIVSVAKPITKYAVAITDPASVRYELEKAYYLAKEGRPGAVLLDIPIDVQFKEIDPEKLRSFELPTTVAPTDSLLKVLELIKNSKRPVILAGGGIQIAGVEQQLKVFVDRTKIPVVTTLNGLDAFEGAYSFAGLHGNTFSNLAIQNSDLLIVLGARLGQRQVGKKPETYTTAKIIHVDADASELGRTMLEEISIKSELKSFLVTIVKEMGPSKFPDFSAWHKTIQAWDLKFEATAHMSERGIDPVRAVKTLSQFFDSDAVITNDVGQNQMWVSQAFRKKGTQRLLNSSGLGAMGYSLPAAIACTFARPGAQVIAFTGDGGLQMNIQELMVVGQRQLPIKCIVLNNNSLGMMREVQKRYYNENYHGANVGEFACVNLEKIASAYELSFVRVTSEDQIPALGEAMKNSKPYLIDLQIAFDSRLSNRYDEADLFAAEKLNES
ncbi:MAG: thiamine pyrophosphate-binding protein [Proteobacteria bacterium]|nr:MAG: thiamine pyrophosphate-binding protein [Pseudomonadota bacterium]